MTVSLTLAEIMAHYDEVAVGPLLTEADLPLDAISDPERREKWRIGFHNILTLSENVDLARSWFEEEMAPEASDADFVRYYRNGYTQIIESRTLDFYDALIAFEAEAGLAGPTVEIACPVCGRRQTVERDMWAFSVTRQHEMGFAQRGHPYTCSGVPEDSHPKVEMQRAGRSP